MPNYKLHYGIQNYDANFITHTLCYVLFANEGWAKSTSAVGLWQYCINFTVYAVRPPAGVLLFVGLQMAHNEHCYEQWPT